MGTEAREVEVCGNQGRGLQKFLWVFQLKEKGGKGKVPML